jgi:hypothetical protein
MASRTESHGVVAGRRDAVLVQRQAHAVGATLGQRRGFAIRAGRPDHDASLCNAASDLSLQTDEDTRRRRNTAATCLRIEAVQPRSADQSAELTAHKTGVLG